MGGMFGGGGKKGGGSTPAPDFSKAAMTNQSGPMGSSMWSTDANGNNTLSSQFTGQAADTFNSLQGGMGKAAAYDPTQARDAAITSNYNQAASRLDPQWQQRQQAFGSGMANQGLDPGSEAYNASFGNESRAMNDAYSTAMANAVRQGNETQTTQMAQMRQPFEQAALMQGMLPKGDPSAPFRAATSQYEAAKDKTSADQAGKGGLLSGLGGVAGTMFGGPLGGALGGGLGSMFGGKGKPPADQNAGYDENLGGYNF
jgi:hypothetical protein